MNIEDLHYLRQLGERPKPSLRADEFDGPDRTLLLGYTSATRSTVHVYYQSGLIHVYVSRPDYSVTLVPGGRIELLHVAGELFEDPSLLVPNKRVQPERSDYGFCAWLIENGYPIAFTTFDSEAILDAERHAPFASFIADSPPFPAESLRSFE